MPKNFKLLALAGAVAAIPGAAPAQHANTPASGAMPGYSGGPGGVIIAVSDTADKHTSNKHAEANKHAEIKHTGPPRRHRAGLIPKAHAGKLFPPSR